MVPLPKKGPDEAKQFIDNLYDEKGKKREVTLSEQKIAEAQEERRTALKKIFLIGGSVAALASATSVAWFGWKVYEDGEEKKQIAQIFDHLKTIEIPDMHVDAFPVNGASKIIVLIEASPFTQGLQKLQATDPQKDADVIRHVCDTLTQKGFPVHTVIGGCHTDGESTVDLGSVQCKNLNMATMRVGDLNHRYARRLKYVKKHPFYAWDTLCDIANHGDLSLTSDEAHLSPMVTVALDRQQKIDFSEKDKKGKAYSTISYDLPQYLFEKGINVIRFKPTETFPEHMSDPKVLP